MTTILDKINILETATEIDILLETYKKYILEDNINNYFRFNFYILTIHINKFAQFLDDLKDNNNNTYLYFKCIYHFCNMQYTNMLQLAENVKESNIYNLLGYYYETIGNDSLLTINYYEMAIQLQNTNAMYNLGNYYMLKSNYILMKKYHIMAAELNNIDAIINLAEYYRKTEIKYELMVKYFEMAAELNNTTGMVGLAIYYKSININYDLMEKYYLMAIELNNGTAAASLGYYYETVKKNYELAKKYYLVAISLGNYIGKLFLRNYCCNIEGNEKNYNEYIYYPRILTLLLSSKRNNRITAETKNKDENMSECISKSSEYKNRIFLPEELYVKIFEDYIVI